MAKEKWIPRDLKKGAFTAQAEAAGKSVGEYAREKQHASGTTGRRARLALTFRKMAREKKRSSGRSSSRR